MYWAVRWQRNIRSIKSLKFHGNNVEMAVSIGDTMLVAVDCGGLVGAEVGGS